MAREKVKVVRFSVPKNAPEGTRFDDVKRAIGKAKDQVVRILLPVPTAEGVLKYTTYLQGILPKDGPTAAECVAEAIRSWVVNSCVAQAGSNEIPAEEVGTIVPRIARVSTVDPTAVAASRMQTKMSAISEAEGKPRRLTAEETEEIYAGLSL